MITVYSLKPISTSLSIYALIKTISSGVSWKSLWTGQFVATDWAIPYLVRETFPRNFLEISTASGFQLSVSETLVLWQPAQINWLIFQYTSHKKVFLPDQVLSA